MADADLLIQIRADVGNAVSGINQVSGKVDELGGHMKKGQEGAANLLKGFLGFEAVKGVFEGAIEGFKSIMEATNKAQASETQLNAVLASTKGVAGVTAEAANHYAESLSGVTRFGKEAVLSTEDLLLTFTSIKDEIMPQATETVLNMATALGEDTKNAAIQLGKALQDPVKGITALHRVGVNFTEAQKEQIKTMVASGNVMGAQRIILAELTTEFGGSAKAAGTTFAGSLDIMNHKIEEAKVKVGEALMPVLTNLATLVAGILTAALNALPGIIDAVKNALNFLAPIVTAIATFIKDNFIPVLASLAVVIGPPLIGAIIAVGTTLATVAIPAAIATVTAFFPIIALAAAIGAAVFLLKQAWDNNFLGMRDILKAVGDAIGTALGWIGDRIKDFMKFLGLQVDDGKKAGRDLGIGWVDECGNAVAEGHGKLVTTVGDTTKAAFDQQEQGGYLATLSADSWINGAIQEVSANGQSLIDECTNIANQAFDQVTAAQQLGINTSTAWIQGIGLGLGKGSWVQVGGAFQTDITQMETGITEKMQFVGETLGKAGKTAGSKLGSGIKDGIKKGISDALAQVRESLDVFNKGMDVLGKLRGFTPVAIESLDAFFNSLDAFTARASIRLQSYVGNFDEFKAKFANAMGDTLDAIGKAVAPLQAIAAIDTLPNALVLDAFFDALDMFVARAQVRLQGWVGNFDDFRAKFANAMGDTLAGISKAIAPLAALAKIDTLPSAGVMDAFFDALDLFVARAIVREQEWVGNFDEFKTKFAGYMGDTVAAIAKTIDTLTKIADINILPGAGAINAFFDALNEFINAFAAKSADWSTKITAEVAVLAGTIGVVAEAIGKIIDPLLKLPELQKISPEAIEGAMANIWLALHHFNEVMKSGELQGGRLNEMVTFANGIKDVFLAIRDALAFLTDKTNPASIVAIWEKAMTDMYLFVHNAWMPSTLDLFKTFFNTMTGYFNSYTAGWVQTWKEAMDKLVPPPLASPPPKFKTFFNAMTGYFETYTKGWVGIWNTAMGSLGTPSLPGIPSGQGALNSGFMGGGSIGMGRGGGNNPIQLQVYLDTQEINQAAYLRQQARGAV